MIELPKVGDRIRLIEMPDDPDPIPVNTTGTVRSVQPAVDQICVDWDIPRSLNLIIGVDKYEIINE